MTDKHLISRDELLAAGALWCPPEWRKSLSAGRKPKSQQRTLFSDLSDDDEAKSEEAAAESSDLDEESEDDGSE